MPEGHSERLKVELMRLPVELVEMVVVAAVGVVELPKASELRVVNGELLMMSLLLWYIC